MTAIAADAVWSHTDVLLNPHYGGSGLYGCEHWTHTLPRRVGESNAARIIAGMQPMSAVEAKDIGLVDEVMPGGRHAFRAAVQQVL
jgi:putative two-component system hydrogenase maturation factor HypX/HoxX